MPVAEDRWLAGRVQPVGINQRVALGFDQLHVLKAGGDEVVNDKVGGPVRRFVILGQRGNTGDAQEVLELFEEPDLVFFDVTVDGYGHVASF
jgi:hypothetical protein